MRNLLSITAVLLASLGTASAEPLVFCSGPQSGIADWIGDQTCDFRELDGTPAFKGTFENALPFANGFTFVRLNGRTLILNQSGETTADLGETALSCSEGFNAAGHSVATTPDGECMLIDTAGQTIPLPEGLQPLPVPALDADQFRVENADGLQGVVDGTGAKIIAPVYDVLMASNSGVFTVAKDGNWRAIDFTAKSALPSRASEIGSFDYRVARFEENGKYGIISPMGETRLPATFADIEAISADYFSAADDSGHYGILKTDGTWLCPPDPTYTLPFGYYASETGPIFISATANPAGPIPRYFGLINADCAVIKPAELILIAPLTPNTLIVRDHTPPSESTTQGTEPSIGDILKPKPLTEKIPAGEGLMALDGTIIVPPVFDRLYPAADGIAMAYIFDGDSFHQGYLTAQGKPIGLRADILTRRLVGFCATASTAPICQPLP